MKENSIFLLINEISSLSFKVEFVDFLDHPGAGEYDQANNIIRVTLKNSKGYDRPLCDIAFILAHELRHAQHEIKGMYKSYYKVHTFTAGAHLMLVALLAERDCDKYARLWLDKFFTENELIKSRFYHRSYSLLNLPSQVLPYKLRKLKEKRDAEYTAKLLEKSMENHDMASSSVG